MFSVSRKQVGVLVMFCVFVAVAAYFLLKLSPVLEPPLLVVFSPDRDMVLNASTTIIEGKVSPHADLTINGRRVYSGEDGVFKTEWDLILGLNRFDFHATNKFGKSAEILRYILVQ